MATHVRAMLRCQRSDCRVNTDLTSPTFSDELQRDDRQTKRRFARLRTYIQRHRQEVERWQKAQSP
jgi:hypothetical protein